MTSKELLSSLQKMADKAKVDPDLKAIVSVELTGSDPAQWTGQVGEGRLVLIEGLAVNPDLTVTGSTETAVNILQKKLNPLMALLTGKVKLSGDMAKIALLKGLLAGKKKN